MFEAQTDVYEAHWLAEEAQALNRDGVALRDTACSATTARGGGFADAPRPETPRPWPQSGAKASNSGFKPTAIFLEKQPKKVTGGYRSS